MKELLPEKLKQGLTEAEEKLLKAAPEGEVADFSSGNEETDNPKKAESWGSERTIRSEFLYWLCVNAQVTSLVHAKGVQIKGAKISGILDFESAILPHPLIMNNCVFDNEVIFSYAVVHTLDMAGSSTNSIFCDGLTVKGSVFLRNATAKGEVNFAGANVGGSLSCIGTTFENENGKALNGNRMTTKGTVFLRNAIAKGEVIFVGANIGGSLECDKATFENAGGRVISGDGLTVKRSVFLNNATAKGEVTFIGANIGGSLECDKATFENAGGRVISGDGLAVKGAVFLRNATAKGEVAFIGANIGDSLSCIGTTFRENIGTLPVLIAKFYQLAFLSMLPQNAKCYKTWGRKPRDTSHIFLPVLLNY